MSASALLEPEFVRELEALRRRLSPRARSAAPGDHLARRRGGSAEFHEHRPYAPGDDLRRVDWAAFARSGEPVLKVFRSEEDVVARIFCDTSASLEFGTPPKIEVAKRIASAVGYMALASSERAQVVVGGRDGVRAHAPERGRGGLPGLLRTLAALEPAGKLDLAAGIEALVARVSRPGLLVVVSDFFDSGPWRDALSRAVAAGHDVALVQVLAAEELYPAMEGDFAFEDCETGAVVELVVDGTSLEAYERRLRELFHELASFARRHGASYVRAMSDEPLEPVVRRLVARAVDR